MEIAAYDLLFTFWKTSILRQDYAIKISRNDRRQQTANYRKQTTDVRA
jgi:hypothetical protein